MEESREEDERRKREEENRRQPRGSDEVFRRNGSGAATGNRQSAASSGSAAAGRGTRAAAAAKKAVSPPPTFMDRAGQIMAGMQALLTNAAQSMTSNPMALFRTILFFIAFALAVGRRDLRERIMQILRRAWEKVRRTVGMGVKVSYI